MDEFDKSLSEIFKRDIYLSNQYTQTVRKTLKELPEKKKSNNFKFSVFRTFATGIACVIFISRNSFCRRNLRKNL